MLLETHTIRGTVKEVLMCKEAFCGVHWEKFCPLIIAVT